MRRYQPGEQPRERWRRVERRRQPRLEPALPVQVCGDVSGVLHDVSRTGLCLLTDEPLAEGSSVVFDLIDEMTGMRCGFEARVIWYRAGYPVVRAWSSWECSPIRTPGSPPASSIG